METKRKLTTNTLLFKIKYFFFRLKYGCNKCDYKFYKYACFVARGNCIKRDN